MRNATEPEDGSMIVGGYALSDTQGIPVHAEPSIYRNTQKKPGRLTLVPYLKAGVPADKEKFTVEDFQIDTQGANLILHVYTSPPTKDSPGKQQDPFKINYKTRAFSHGNVFKGPKTAEDGSQYARINRACREALIFLRDRVEGFEDIFVENNRVVARYLGSEAPPVTVPDDATFEEIQAQRPGGRPTQAGSAASVARIKEAEVVETPNERKKTATKPQKPESLPQEIQELLAANVSFIAKNNQGAIEVEIKAPALLAEKFADKFLRIAKFLFDGGTAQLRNNRPGSMLVEPQRLLDWFDQQLMETESTLEDVIRYGSHNKLFPGRPGYETAVKYLERFVAQLNRKEFLDGLPGVVVDYMILSDVGLVDRGASSSAATQPVGAGRIFRKVPDVTVPDATATDQHVEAME